MIIGCCGKMQSGKGELTRIAVREYDAVNYSFAGELKLEVKDFLTKSGVKFEDRNLYGTGTDKEELFSIPQIAWRDSFPEFIKFVETNGVGDSWFVENVTASFRSLLQWWGTEYRRSQDDNYWVNKTLNKCTDPDTLYVIDDCRFLNEAMSIRKMGGVLIKISRACDFNGSNSTHASEVELEQIIGHIYLTNNGKLADYHVKCYNAIKCAIEIALINSEKYNGN